MKFSTDQEADAIRYFRKLIKPWRAKFAEDNWPTAASHLHELLHRAMIAEGARPQQIAFLAQDDWNVPASPTSGKGDGNG